MADYRVYVIGRDGLFIEAVLLNCDDDGLAIEAAKQFRGDHVIELWTARPQDRNARAKQADRQNARG